MPLSSGELSLPLTVTKSQMWILLDTKVHQQMEGLLNNPSSRDDAVLGFLSFLSFKSTLPPSLLQLGGHHRDAFSELSRPLP